MVGEERVLAHDSAGRVFIDRDPVLFEPILDFLRHGLLPDPLTSTPQVLTVLFVVLTVLYVVMTVLFVVLTV